MPDAPGRNNSLDPVRVLRAEELWLGVGPGVVPQSTRHIEKQLMQEFGVCQRQARYYLTAARTNLARIAKHNGEKPEALIERADARLTEAFAAAKAKGDASSMVQAAQRQAELHGLVKREVQVEAKGTLADAFAGLLKVVASESAESKDAASDAAKVEE